MTIDDAIAQWSSSERSARACVGQFSQAVWTKISSNKDGDRQMNCRHCTWYYDKKNCSV
jgi:hypothetical protein